MSEGARGSRARIGDAIREEVHWGAAGSIRNSARPPSPFSGSDMTQSPLLLSDGMLSVDHGPAFPRSSLQVSAVAASRPRPRRSRPARSRPRGIVHGHPIAADHVGQVQDRLAGRDCGRRPRTHAAPARPASPRPPVPASCGDRCRTRWRHRDADEGFLQHLAIKAHGPCERPPRSGQSLSP